MIRPRNRKGHPSAAKAGIHLNALWHVCSRALSNRPLNQSFLEFARKLVEVFVSTSDWKPYRDYTSSHACFKAHARFDCSMYGLKPVPFRAPSLWDSFLI